MITRKYVVFGEDCRDIFLYGRATRLAPEGPFPVFVTENKEENLGCAANVVRNLKSLDPESKVFFYSNEFPIFKTRFVDKSSNYALMRHDENEPVLPLNNDKLEAGLQKIREAEAVIISDYNKGLLTKNIIKKILEESFKQGVTTFVDTKKLINEETFNFSTFIKINQVEYEFNKKHKFNEKYFKPNLIVTLGGEGMKWRDEIFPTKRVEVRDLSGAGDTALAGLVVGFSDYCDIRAAIEFANKAAAVAVSKKGVVAVNRGEVL